MNEKLIIRNFGPIENMEFDFRRINIFIGDQGTGKSTVMKILCMCRYFTYISNNYYASRKSFEDGLFIWGINDFLKNDTYIEYSNSHYEFKIDFSKSESEYKNLTPISSEFKKILDTFNQWYPNPEEFDYENIDFSDIPINFFLKDVAEILDNPFFIPVERGLQSLFSLGKNSIGNLSDSLYNQFSKIDSIARSFKKSTFIEPLNLEYRNDNGVGKYRDSNQGEYYQMATAASGYQALIPISLICLNYAQKKNPKTIIVEEPELNLFPETQYNLIKYFVKYNNMFSNQFFLTTHSPYILSSLNNLMYSYKLGVNHFEKINKIIPEEYWLKPFNISCYSLEEGRSIEILDRNIGLINTKKIDSVSKIMGEEFDKLLAIDVEFNSDEN